MAAKERLLIVSFGDSEKYRYQYTEDSDETTLHHRNHLESVEKEISKYLEEKYPGQSLAYYYSPKVTEIRIEDAADYASYPELNTEAIEAIKKVLDREIMNREDQQELDLNAPFAQIDTNY